MLLALFEVFPCVIRTLDSPVKLCMSLILCFKMLLLCVFSRTVCGTKRAGQCHYCDRSV